MRDFTSKYNTPLTPEQQALFDAWAAEESIRQGRRVKDDLYNYDLQGMWLAGSGFGGGNNHATDTFKKPNHPTFSDQSQYHGVDGWEGGHWEVNPFGGGTFTVGPTNMYGYAETKDYFGRAEPGFMPVFSGGLLGLIDHEDE